MESVFVFCLLRNKTVSGSDVGASQAPVWDRCHRPEPGNFGGTCPPRDRARVGRGETGRGLTSHHNNRADQKNIDAAKMEKQDHACPRHPDILI